ncbi:hypothetical protein J4E80_009004 [Alternaria sp. BMP 0032]|nr:hypothetical protein J4E80_009004 [Alternaria sp. BMP 0032]
MASTLTATQHALGIAELLENILQHLSPADALSNKQMVSSTFYNCINRSSVLRQIFLLDANRVEEDEADSKLYFPLSNIFPAYGSHEGRGGVLIPGYKYRPFIFLNLAAIRCFVPADSYYIDQAAASRAFIPSGKDRLPRLKTGSRSWDWEAPITQVRPSAIHPFIARNLWIKDGFFWTGFGSHAIVFMEDPLPISKLGLSSTKVSRAIEEILSQVQRSPTASWIKSTLSNPAFTTVSLVMHWEISNRSTRVHFVHRFKSFRRATGVLVDDLLILLARYFVERLESAGRSNALYVPQQDLAAANELARLLDPVGYFYVST